MTIDDADRDRPRDLGATVARGHHDRSASSVGCCSVRACGPHPPWTGDGCIPGRRGEGGARHHFPRVLPPPRNRGARRVVSAGRGAYGGVRSIGGDRDDDDPGRNRHLGGGRPGGGGRRAAGAGRGAELVLLYVRPEGDLRSVVDPGWPRPRGHLAQLRSVSGVRVTAGWSGRAGGPALPSRRRCAPTRSWSATAARTGRGGA